MKYEVLEGDVLTRLAEIPDESMQCVVTSPPYFALRDYGVSGQIGLERTPEEYVEKMVAVFREVRRVLRKDGTLWLNIGDSYAQSGGPGWQGKNGQRADRRFTAVRDTVAQREINRRAPRGLKSKDLVGIPWRLAFALQADGWWLRSDIIWSKPNPMPESVTDRPTKSHEYVFLLTKSARYFYDAEAVREPSTFPQGPNAPDKIKSPYGQGFTRRNDEVLEEADRKAGRVVGEGGGRDGLGRLVDKQRGHSRRHAGFNDRWDAMEKARQCDGGRNLRSVWTIATQPFSGAQYLGDVGDDSGRKRSVDCPMHGDRERPGSTGQDDEQRAASRSAGNPGNGGGPLQGPQDALSPTQMRLDGDSSPGSSGLRDRACSPTASDRNIGSRRTARAPLTSPHGIGDEVIASRIDDTAPGRGSVATFSRTVESSIGPDSGADERARRLSAKTGDRNGDKCSCVIIDHFAVFPEELAERCIKAGTKQGDMVLDPFAGSGTVGAVAIGLQRNFVGIELNPDYAAMARRRIGAVAPLIAEVV